MQLFKINWSLTISSLIVSNEEMSGIIEIIKLLEESRVLVKGISEAMKNETK